MSQFANIAMSLYLLFLACMPCHDTIEKVDKNVKTIVRSDTDSQASHEEDSDLCSPLCSCACCGNLMIAPSTEQSIVREDVPTQTVFPAETKDTSGFISLLWQPPQLA